MNTLRLNYRDEADLDEKLKIILECRGYIVFTATKERISVRELARRVGKNLSNVSTRLRSPHCPAFVCAMGKKRILWLEPNERLLSFLRNSTTGQRNDLK